MKTVGEGKTVRGVDFGTGEGVGFFFIIKKKKKKKHFWRLIGTRKLIINYFFLTKINLI